MAKRLPDKSGIDFQAVSARLRRIRVSRGKSLRVTAGLAGISISHLSDIERGERALDSISHLVGLANALQISPSEIVQLPVPAPGNARTDAAINQIRLALLAVTHNHPGGNITPTQELHHRVNKTLNAYLTCEELDHVGTELPQLIRDLHTTIDTGRDTPEVLGLAVLLHTHATLGWLRVAGAHTDLRSQVASVTKQLAENRDTPMARGLAVYAGLYILVVTGATDVAWHELNSVDVPTTDQAGVQLAGTLALCRSFVAAVAGRPSEVTAALETAQELSRRADNSNAYGLGFCPLEVSVWNLFSLVESGYYEQATYVGDHLRLEEHPIAARRAQGLVTYGRALARVVGRREDAVVALQRAEVISAHEVRRNQIARDLLGELVKRGQRDAVGRDLRGLAYRAGVQV